jgi:hypothetical protein
MKKFIIIAFFNSFIFCSLSQINFIDNYPEFEIDTVSSDFNTTRFDSRMPENFSPYDLHYKNWGKGNITNIEVSRNPAEVLITNDDQFAFVRCYLSNNLEVIKISTGEIVKSFSIPCPKDFLLSNNGDKLYVASLRDEPFPPNPPPDDCSIIGIPLSGQSILTTISIPLQEIIKIDTIKTWFIRRLLKSPENNIIYIQGNEVLEYNLSNSTILRNWPFSEQILKSKIDNKNNRIFLTTIDSTAQKLLKVIDLNSGDVLTSQYYTNGENAWARQIGLDTLSNRVFIQGKSQPTSEVLVFDAISLNQLPPIVGAFMGSDSFIPCPKFGSLFIGGDYPNNTMELDYMTLELKQILPFPLYTHYHTFHLSKDMSRLFSFQYGSSEGGGSYINPPQYLDVVEYDIETGNFWQYNTTEQKYECSYERSLETTINGHYLIATNSPENTVSIIEIPYSNINALSSINLITVFPNPTSDIINISFEKQIHENFTIEIYDCIGSLLHKFSGLQSAKEYLLDMTKYKNGHYYLHIESNELSRFIKIIKI